jgi:hypothetical protein
VTSLSELGSGTLTLQDVNKMLYEAARTGDIDTILRLFRNEPLPEINSKHWHNETALDAASRCNHVEIMKLLVQKNGNVDLSPRALMKAAQGNSLEALLYLVEASKDPPSYVNSVNDYTSETALHYACSPHGQASLKILDALIGSGARINAQNCNGDTGLHFASSANYGEHVEWLLNNGADPSIINDDKGTAWEVAAKERSWSAIGAFAHKETDKGITHMSLNLPPLEGGKAETEWNHIVDTHSVSRNSSNSHRRDCTNRKTESADICKGFTGQIDNGNPRLTKENTGPSHTIL